MTTETDAEMEDVRKRINGLKFRYQLLKRFREFGSQACVSKLYETKCEATEDFFSLNIANLFDKAKTSVVMVTHGRIEKSFNTQDSAQMTPKNKFFLLYALGFNNSRRDCWKVRNNAKAFILVKDVNAGNFR